MAETGKDDAVSLLLESVNEEPRQQDGLCGRSGLCLFMLRLLCFPIFALFDQSQRCRRPPSPGLIAQCGSNRHSESADTPMIPIPVLPQRWYVYAAALLCFSPGWDAIAQRTSPVPTRDLAAAVAEMKQSAPAYIHTHFATGAGFVLQSGDQVVTARHNLLTPTGELATEVGVGLPQPPLNNIVERRATPVAQDPAEDLVLLRLTGGAVQQVSPSTPAFQAVTKIAAVAPCDSSAALRLPRDPHELQLVRARLRPASNVHEVRVPPVKAKLANHTSTPAVTRIVWDGPATANAPRAAVHKAPAAQARLHIVWDGPLRH